MTHRYQKHYRGDFGHPTDGESRHPVVAHLSIGSFGSGASLPVHGLGFLRGHALTPPHHLGTITVAGLVALLLRFALGQLHRSVHRDVPFLQGGDRLPGGNNPRPSGSIRDAGPSAPSPAPPWAELDQHPCLH